MENEGCKSNNGKKVDRRKNISCLVNKELMKISTDLSLTYFSIFGE